ncbi:MAG: hypothetical protein AB7R69_05960, partial [Candidatus Babeliales bacterium]
MKILSLLSLFFLISCVADKKTPEGALREFVESRYGNIIPREFVLERVTGKLKASFENMSDEDFQKYADLRNLKKQSFKVLSSSCQESRCYLTYLVSYSSIKDDKTEFVTEVKKIAELNLVDGKWLINDVSN